MLKWTDTSYTRRPNCKTTGLEYLYTDLTGMDKIEASVFNYKPINNPHGVLANTLEPLFIPTRSMVRLVTFKLANTRN
ncbi:hypothetical protein PAMA_007399 [Pampus argenteus]